MESSPITWIHNLFFTLWFLSIFARLFLELNCILTCFGICLFWFHSHRLEKLNLLQVQDCVKRGQGWEITRISRSKCRWQLETRLFYIGNPAPSLPKCKIDPPLFVLEWMRKSTPGSDDQMKELMDLIWYLRAMGVTASSLIFNWMQRKVQPLKRRDNFGFQYEETQDTSRFFAEPMERSEGLKRIKTIFPDLCSVPCVPPIFRTNNPPSEVTFLLSGYNCDYFVCRYSKEYKCKFVFV